MSNKKDDRNAGEQDLLGILAEFGSKTNERVHAELDAAGMRTGMMFYEGCRRLTKPEYKPIFEADGEGKAVRSPVDLIKDMSLDEMYRFCYELQAMAEGAPKLLKIAEAAIMLRSLLSGDRDDVRVSMVRAIPKDK